MTMVKAGTAVDAVINDLQRLLEPGDILIDGGTPTSGPERRRSRCSEGIHFWEWAYPAGSPAPGTDPA